MALFLMVDGYDRTSMLLDCILICTASGTVVSGILQEVLLIAY
jgi:hypothetical protein